MSNDTTNNASNANLTAEENADGWSVVDPAGGRWWPHEDAAEEIGSSADPAAAAVTMCDASPMRGRWAD